MTILLLLLAGLAACGPSAAETTLPTAAPVEPAALTTLDSAALATPATPAGEAYPPAVDAQPAEAYPAAVEESYPAPVAEEFKEPRFRIDQPVSATATTITGQAPPDVALAVLDVTYNGALLGTGRSDANGAFSIPISGLIEGNRIGLAIGELTEGQTLNQMAELYYPHRGEGFMNLPNVGIFFDTTLVQP